MQATAPRTNRIPRIAAPRPSLCRRLHRWWRRLQLTTRIKQLECSEATLRHEMGLNEAAMAVHRLRFTKSPVLQQAMSDQRLQMGLLQIDLMQLRLDLAELESEVPL